MQATDNVNNYSAAWKPAGSKYWTTAEFQFISEYANLAPVCQTWVSDFRK